MLQIGSVAEGKRQGALDTIVRNARAQNQLIDDLLDVSRIVSGKLLLSVAPVYFDEIIEAALENRPALQRTPKRGPTRRRCSMSAAGHISGDAGRLQQVVWNLLANAVKFTPRGGRVHVVLRRYASSAEIAIADTGLGIAPEFLPYVFDRFRQQDGAITRRAGGLGLGLAIVKSYRRALTEGRSRAHSREGLARLHVHQSGFPSRPSRRSSSRAPNHAIRPTSRAPRT